MRDWRTQKRIYLTTTTDTIILSHKELASRCIRRLNLWDPQVNIVCYIPVINEIRQRSLHIPYWIAGAVLIHVLRVRQRLPVICRAIF